MANESTAEVSQVENDFLNSYYDNTSAEDLQPDNDSTGETQEIADQSDQHTQETGDDETAQADIETGDTSPEGDGAEAEEQQQTLELSVDDIAAAFGVDPAKFSINDQGQLMIKTNIDGKLETVTFDDAIGNYQRRGYLDKQANENNLLKQKLVDEQKAASEQYAAKLDIAQDLITLSMQDLVGKYTPDELRELARDDPGEYLAYQQQAQALQGRLQQIRQEREQESNKLTKQIIAENERRLVEEFPAWGDHSVAKQEMAALRDYAADQLGFEKKFMEAVTDAKIFRLLSDSREYRKLQAEKPQVKKLVRQAVKVSQPGKAKDTSKAPLSDEELFYGNSR